MPGVITKTSDESFLKSKCNGCIWIRKVDGGHYLCPFKGCMKDEEDKVAKESSTDEGERC